MLPVDYPERVSSLVEKNELRNYSEISLLDVYIILKESWKKLAIASILGIILGFGSWSYLASYSAEYIVFNTKSSNAIDFLSWRGLQKSLPKLAKQIIQENKAPENQLPIYGSMGNEEFWIKDVFPIYSFSMSDAKNFPEISKEMESASNTIFNLTIKAKGNSPEQAASNAKAIFQFLRTGGAYLEIRSLLGYYDTYLVDIHAQLHEKINKTQSEINFHQLRTRELESLQKRYPQSNLSSQQMFDLKDVNVKYLPIQNQIIGVNNEISLAKQRLSQLQGRLAQADLMANFLRPANNLLAQNYDGLILGKDLLDIESKLRTTLSRDDGFGVEFLDNLRSRLLGIQARYTKGLYASGFPSDLGKKGLAIFVAIGFVAAIVLMFLGLLIQRLWTVKKHY